MSASLTVIIIPDDTPPDAACLVCPGGGWYWAPLLGGLVLHIIHLFIFCIGGGEEHVVGDVVQVATELEPGSSGRDVVCRTLSLHLLAHRTHDLMVHTVLKTCCHSAIHKSL